MIHCEILALSRSPSIPNELLALKFVFISRSPSIGPNKPQAVVNPSQVMRSMCPFIVIVLIDCLFTYYVIVSFFLNLFCLFQYGDTPAAAASLFKLHELAVQNRFLKIYFTQK